MALHSIPLGLALVAACLSAPFARAAKATDDVRHAEIGDPRVVGRVTPVDEMTPNGIPGLKNLPVLGRMFLVVPQAPAVVPAGTPAPGGAK
jgi:hypothetical protein